VACTIAAEPDRKVVKAVNKAAKQQGARLVSRPVDAADADKWQAEVDALADDVNAIYREEREEKQLAQVEMQVKKGENLIEHEAEINSRPKRTWFESEKDKKKAREAGRAELNGLREKDRARLVRDKLKKKHGGKFLSNKDKKKLDAKAERAESQGRAWEKTRAVRLGGVKKQVKQKSLRKARR
jgi:ATP-dependent RNA helicase DDX27